MAPELFICTPRVRCSYRIATIAVCSCNIVAALYVLQSLITPLFFTPYPSALTAGVLVQTGRSPLSAVRYTQEQLNRMKEAVSVWKAAVPLELIKRVKEIQEESVGVYGSKQDGVVKGGEASGLVQRLKELRDSSSKTDQEALEEWRKKKLEEAKKRSEAMKAKQEEYLM